MNGNGDRGRQGGIGVGGIAAQGDRIADMADNERLDLEDGGRAWETMLDD